MSENKIKKGLYRHYKGNEYEILDVAHHSETLEDMVVYRAMYGKRETWVRPASMWNETVEINGTSVKRFEYIGPAFKIRPFSVDDADFVLSLNKENVEVLAPMDKTRLFDFAKTADTFLIAETNGEKAAFLIALRENVKEYDSENYIWFSNHFDKFVYVDRIVITEKYRKMGLGRMLYNEIFKKAKENGIRTVCAEIDTVPYNGTSLAFHDSMGFSEVGEQFVRNGTVKVSLQTADI